MNSQNVVDIRQEQERRVSIDRRSAHIDFKRRNFDRRSKVFKYERSIHLNDTNAFGSVYFARFFDYQGEAREDFLKFLLGDRWKEFVACRYGLVTVSATCNYHAPLFLYDNLQVNIKVPTPTRTKVTMEFQLVRQNDMTQVATGQQVIGFTDSESKPIPVPDIIVDSFKDRQLLSE